MITDIDKIKEFVVSNDCFHDYRLSDLIVNESMFSISFEEDMRTQDNVGGKRVTFKIENYEELDISIDCIIPPYVHAMEFVENDTINIDFTNGEMSIKYYDIEFSLTRHGIVII